MRPGHLRQTRHRSLPPRSHGAHSWAAARMSLAAPIITATAKPCAFHAMPSRQAVVARESGPCVCQTVAPRADAIPSFRLGQSNRATGLTEAAACWPQCLGLRVPAKKFSCGGLAKHFGFAIMSDGRAPPKPDLKKALTGPCPAREGAFLRCIGVSRVSLPSQRTTALATSPGRRLTPSTRLANAVPSRSPLPNCVRWVQQSWCLSAIPSPLRPSRVPAPPVGATFCAGSARPMGRSAGSRRLLAGGRRLHARVGYPKDRGSLSQ